VVFGGIFDKIRTLFFVKNEDLTPGFVKVTSDVDDLNHAWAELIEMLTVSLESLGELALNLKGEPSSHNSLAVAGIDDNPGLMVVMSWLITSMIISFPRGGDV
jgi:hypothetical protein